MPLPQDVYVNCDVLENLPKENRENWRYEMTLLKKELPKNAKVLQVGSMDATRIIKLLEIRPDLKITGLEIEASLVKVAQQRIAAAKINAHIVHGDITHPPRLAKFDVVICLNNTLGYITPEKEAIENMKILGERVIISVYGEKFNDTMAENYFKTIGLTIDKIENNMFVMKGFTRVKRYTQQEVESWKGRTIKTPLGYFCVLNSKSLKKRTHSRI